MTSTRQITKRKIEQMIDKLKTLEMIAIDIGLQYQNADAPVSHVMLVISEMVKVTVPLLEETNDNL